MASSTLPQQNGLSFCLTKYKGSTYQDVQACICIEGFSIIQATVNLSERKENLQVGGLMISLDTLFEYGLLKKLIIT